MSRQMRRLPQLIAAAFVLAYLPCAPGHAADVRTVTSGDGRKVEIRDTSRIVTIGAAVTEVVFALGHGKEVVAVDQTSTFPAAVRERPNVGYMRALSAEGVLSLAPTLIVATEGSGPPDVIGLLSRAAVPFVIVPEGYDEAGVLRKVRLIAEVLGESKRGDEMLKAMQEDFHAMKEQRQKIAKARKAVFVLAVGSGSPTVGGAETSADGIFEMAGVENAMKAVHGYKPAVAESTFTAGPEVVVTMIERNHGLDAKAMFSQTAFAGTPAARDERLVSIPSYYLSFGPRTAHAANRLASEIYPELKLAPLPPRPWTASIPAAQ
jgi:iron complex transport system substrate-binding protein